MTQRKSSLQISFEQQIKVEKSSWPMQILDLLRKLTFIPSSIHHDFFSLANSNLIFLVCALVIFLVWFLHFPFLQLCQNTAAYFDPFIFHLFWCTFAIFKAHYFDVPILTLTKCLSWSTSMLSTFDHPVSIRYAQILNTGGWKNQSLSPYSMVECLLEGILQFFSYYYTLPFFCLSQWLPSDLCPCSTLVFLKCWRSPVILNSYILKILLQITWRKLKRPSTWFLNKILKTMSLVKEKKLKTKQKDS